jgi:para-aminobenzoate synthetase/4-amino-4-deoxychorismate lyase
VTVLSDAVSEWREMLLKARPLLRAVALATTHNADAFAVVPSRAAHAAPIDAASAPRAHGASKETLTGTGVATGAGGVSTRASLVETMLHTPSHGFFLWDEHIKRMGASARALGFCCADGEAAEAQSEGLERCLDRRLRSALEAAAREWPATEASRVRVTYAADGALGISRTALLCAELPPISLEPSVLSRGPAFRVRLDSRPVSSADSRLAHKSNARAVYDEARARVGVSTAGEACPPFVDVLLINEAGELTETSIANIALQDANGRWRTPPTDCGLLAGTMRARLLETGQLYEGVLTLEDLGAALREGRQLVGFNSVRGVYALRLEARDEQRSESRPQSRL